MRAHFRLGATMWGVGEALEERFNKGKRNSGFENVKDAVVFLSISKSFHKVAFPFPILNLAYHKFA